MSRFTECAEPHCALTGEACVTSVERADARQQNASPLFGEMVYEGVSSLASSTSLGIGSLDVQRVIDFGAGLGKAAIQLFFQHPHLLHVLGVELMPSRYNIAADAMHRLYRHLTCGEGKTETSRFRLITEPKRVRLEEIVDSGERRHMRLLEIRRQNMFELEYDLLHRADVILCDVDLHLVCARLLCSSLT